MRVAPLVMLVVASLGASEARAQDWVRGPDARPDRTETFVRDGVTHARSTHHGPSETVFFQTVHPEGAAAALEWMIVVPHRPSDPAPDPDGGVQQASRGIPTRLPGRIYPLAEELAPDDGRKHVRLTFELRGFNIVLEEQRPATAGARAAWLVRDGKEHDLEAGRVLLVEADGAFTALPVELDRIPIPAVLEQADVQRIARAVVVPRSVGVSGIVRQTDGRGFVGALVILRGEGLGGVTRTDGRGHFEVRAWCGATAAPSDVTVRAEKEGHAAVEQVRQGAERGRTHPHDLVLAPLPAPSGQDQPAGQ